MGARGLSKEETWELVHWLSIGGEGDPWLSNIDEKSKTTPLRESRMPRWETGKLGASDMLPADPPGRDVTYRVRVRNTGRGSLGWSRNQYHRFRGFCIVFWVVAAVKMKYSPSPSLSRSHSLTFLALSHFCSHTHTKKRKKKKRTEKNMMGNI